MKSDFTNIELLTPAQMSEADKLTVKETGKDSFLLMQNAGKAISNAVINYFESVKTIAILCGPGNNGGDGYSAAQILNQSGFQVVCYTLKKPKSKTDAQKAFKIWTGETKRIQEFNVDDYELIIDGMFGAGLDRALSVSLIKLIEAINKSKKPVIAIDLPSGVSGQTGAVMGAALQASFTITFFRYKLGHWLYPGRQLCGQHLLVDIGVKKTVLQDIKPLTTLNLPILWKDKWPKLSVYDHKYSRGHVAVFSGPAIMTGASRLSAKAAQRIGAGAVTLLSSKKALSINASHLTSIMLYPIKTNEEVLTFVNNRKVKAVILGPGFGKLKKALEFTKTLITNTNIKGLVLDADALTAFQNKTDKLITLIADNKVPIVITPHEGEFAKLFPDLADNDHISRIEKALCAAKRLNTIVVYKGADTIIAAPDGRMAININGTPLLATAGSGDVLSGVIAGLIAQDMCLYEAACAAVWLHAACAQQLDLGMIAEDLPEILPKALSKLIPDINTIIEK